MREPHAGRPLGAGTLQRAIAASEAVIYGAIGVLLVTAAGITVVDTVHDLFGGRATRSVADTTVFVLGRSLLMFIIAELLYTLRLVDFGGHRILVEPFLFIGLIAVVRRVLVLTAEADGRLSHQETEDILLQLAALGGLALVLAIAIHLLRGSDDTSATPP